MILNWQKQDSQLLLSGELTAQTLLPLWQQRSQVMQSIHQIDVSDLSKVDTAGLALLVHLCYQHASGCQLRGVSRALASLIALCNLASIIK